MWQACGDFKAHVTVSAPHSRIPAGKLPSTSSLGLPDSIYFCTCISEASSASLYTVSLHLWRRQVDITGCTIAWKVGDDLLAGPACRHANAVTYTLVDRDKNWDAVPLIWLMN